MIAGPATGCPHNWGDEGYAQEELVAELGAAFLSADLGITPEVRDEHAAYLHSWLEILKQDTRAIFTAAHAQRAVDYLKSLQAAQTSQKNPFRHFFDISPANWATGGTFKSI